MPRKGHGRTPKGASQAGVRPCVLYGLFHRQKLITTMQTNKQDLGSLTSGHFGIFKLLEFAANNPIVPVGRGGAFSEYRKLTNELTSKVPSQPGWYWWGKFDENSNWQTIYLGKSENRQTSSLHARIS